MLNHDHLKFALDDARTRQAALVELIYSIERQAAGLLRLYVTLGLTSASAGTAILFGTFAAPRAVGFGLLGVVATLLAGSWCCFRAMKSASICLPGAGAEFWEWANHEHNSFEKVAAAYLENLREKQKRDVKLNKSTASSLAMAKRLGVLTPLVALAVACAAEFAAAYFVTL